MPAQSSISSLLSLSPSAQPGKPQSRGNDDSFRRLLEQPSAAAQAQRSRAADAARERDATALNAAQADRHSNRPEPSGRREPPGRSEPSAQREPSTQRESTARSDANHSRKDDHVGSRADTRTTDRGRTDSKSTNEPSGPVSEKEQAEEISLEEAEALLERLSDKEWAQLSEDAKTVLAELKAQVDAGALDPALEEALQQLLSSLENGAPLDAIAEQLEAIPLDALPALAAQFPDAQNLRDVLGKRGAAYLSQLSAIARGEPSAGKQTGGAATLLNPGGSSETEGLDLTALLEAGKTGMRSSREEFGLLLQSLARGQGEQAKPVDLSASGTSASALAQLENGARAQPVAPADRQFTVQSDVRVPVGQGQWGEAVSQRVLWMASQKISSAELRLDPPDLGPVQVRVSSHQDQISVTFTSAQPAVREALDQSAARLREMFTEQGLDLVDVNVSDQSGGESMAGEGDGQRGGARQGGAEDDGDVQSAPRILGDRLVDHYA
ncbi:flagellar hook-length control protein FliK [Marinimicrobium locisalis]|uniref:flagellar hook-length control protein FliK n=1 Tax=Marinimicrobium locisalis TaxID=546022 RepID=UPI0032220F56